MTAINRSKILSIFTPIKDAILANTVLKVKFNTTNIYQYEPKHKSHSFKGFPYFWANVPTDNEAKIVINSKVMAHELDVPVVLRLDWEAREKTVDYANAFLEAIADAEPKFQTLGYYDVEINVIGTDPNQIINQKQMVETEFSIMVHGSTGRV